MLLMKCACSWQSTWLFGRCLLQADARHTLLVRQLSSVYSEITSGVSEGIGDEIFGWQSLAHDAAWGL